MGYTLNGLPAAFRLIAGASEVFQSFHYGYTQDLNTPNMGVLPDTLKNYPLLLMVVPQGEAVHNVNDNDSDVEVVLYALSTMNYKNNGQTDPTHTVEDYNSELRVALNDVIQRFDAASRIVVSEDPAVRYKYYGLNNMLAERLIGVRAEFTVRITTPCAISTVGPIDDSAILNELQSDVDPYQLLDETQI